MTIRVDATVIEAQKRAVIAKHMETAAGRSTLAANMNRPLRDYRDYTSVGRKAFFVDPLPQGSLPYYDKDPLTPAYVIGEEGRDVTVVAKGERVFAPLFEIASLVRIPLTQVQQRRYNIQSRVKEKTQAEVIREEDRMIFNLLSKIGNDPAAPNAPVAVLPINLSISTISKAMSLIERHGNIRASNIFLNAVHNTALRDMNSTGNGGHFIDFETSKELMSTGLVGVLYGCTIYTSPEVPEDEIYVTGEPEFTGTVVEAQPITVLTADSAEERAVGFSIFEQVGILVHNSKAVAMIKIAS